MEFFIEHWAELLIAAMAFAKAVLNLIPSEHPSHQVFGYIDIIITAITGDRLKNRKND